jgi:hypothetical protein
MPVGSPALGIVEGEVMALLWDNINKETLGVVRANVAHHLYLHLNLSLGLWYLKHNADSKDLKPNDSIAHGLACPILGESLYAAAERSAADHLHALANAMKMRQV